MVNPDYGMHDNATSMSTSGGGGRQRQFVGYIVDLLHELSYIIQFDYDIRPVHDASFGHRRLDGTWDGIVGQLMDGVGQSVRSACTPRAAVRFPRVKYSALEII